MKICPKCHAQQLDDKQEQCKNCDARFVSLADTIYLDKSQLNEIADDILKSPRLILSMLLLIFAFGIGVYEVAESKVSASIRETKDKTDQQLATFYQEMTNRIEAEFQTPRIKETLTQVATAQASTLLKQQVSPSIERFRVGTSNTLVQFDTSLQTFKSESTNALADVKGVVDLTMDMVMAEDDDRPAFWRLKQQLDSGTNKYVHAIGEVINTIITKLQQESSPYYQVQVNWDFFKFNPDTNTFEAYIGLFNSIGDPTTQSLILKKLSEQSQFPREKKLEIYRELLERTPSLLVLAQTCTIVNNDAHFDLNIFGEPQYLAWVDSQIRELTISNYTASLATNQTDVNSYMARATLYEEETNFPAAIKDYKKAVTLSPTNCVALNECAWFLAVCPDGSLRDGKLAVKYAKKACELDHSKTWNFVGTLAAAYAEAGDFNKAVQSENAAIVMAKAAAVDDGQINGETRRLKLFEQNKPCHEMPTVPGDPF